MEVKGQSERRINWFLKGNARMKNIPVMEREVYLDNLTKISNEKAFYKDGQKMIEVAKREKIVAHVFFFDLNNFKLVNDKIGHTKGDDVVVMSALTLKTTFSRAGDLVARKSQGGDEFIVLAYTNRAGADIMAKRSVDNFQKKIDSSPELKNLGLSFSVGVAEVGEYMKSEGEERKIKTFSDLTKVDSERLLTSALEVADMRMYQDKKIKKANG